MRTKDDLKKLQAFPLGLKILITKQRIREWVDWWGSDRVYVSFSGGKDSTVLLDLVRREYPYVEAVFVNTGLEYPEIQQFVRTFENVTILRPEMRFDDVIRKYGYPVISKEVSLAVWYARKGSKWANNYFDGLDGKGKPHHFNKAMYSKYKPLTETDFMCSDKCCHNMKEKPLDDFIKYVKNTRDFSHEMN